MRELWLGPSFLEVRRTGMDGKFATCMWLPIAFACAPPPNPDAASAKWEVSKKVSQVPNGAQLVQCFRFLDPIPLTAIVHNQKVSICWRR